MRSPTFIFISGSDFPNANQDRRFVALEAPGRYKEPYLGTKLRTAELGKEKLCTKCMEWWPADGEFFHPDKGGIGGLFYCCKACYHDMKDLRKRLREMVTEPEVQTPAHPGN